MAKGNKNIKKKVPVIRQYPYRLDSWPKNRDIYLKPFLFTLSIPQSNLILIYLKTSTSSPARQSAPVKEEEEGEEEEKADRYVL
ncbi:hypothetical protein E2C01_060577 [Portunus trituberculatus]|uniref:Uncharacterized protein n=1 Tax=Portunus trituberculatus TaxID=210409 RepID=A0A5B7H2W0_PORTR|nr:hypothetical protein [Portunus trituberculatus]